MATATTAERRRAQAEMGANLRPSTRRAHARLAAADRAADAAENGNEPAPSSVRDGGAAPAPAGKTIGAHPGQALAGVICGLFVWGYAINWIRGGIAQANGWLAAKFINQPYSAGGPAATAPTSAGSGGSTHLTRP